MAVALLLGPALVRRSGVRPVNHYLRRDFGVWAALAGLIHFFAATDVSMSQEYLAQYVRIETTGLSASLRESLFSWGSIAGFIAGLILLVLLLISNDWSLRKFGQKHWRRVQKSSFAALVLTVLHGLAFQLLESRWLILVAGLLILGFAVFAIRWIIFQRK